MTAALFLLIPVAILGFILCAYYWRVAVPATIIWVVFEGAARKWGFPQYQSVIYLLKDGVILAAFVGFLLDKQAQQVWHHINRTFLGLAAIWIVFLGLMLFNTSSPSVVLSFVGIKNHLTYLPLAVMVPAIISQPSELLRFMRWYMVLTIFVGILGLFQFTQPPSAWVNLQLSFDNVAVEAVSRFGQGSGYGDFQYGRVRTSGTFSYIGGFTTFLILTIPMAVALLFTDILRGNDRRLAYVAIVFAMGAAFTTGSRTPIVVMLIGLPLMLLVAMTRRLITPGLFVRLLGAATLAGIALVGLFSSAITALLYRSATADSASGRFLTPITELIAAFDVSPIFGTGLGTNSNAAASIMKSPFMYWLDGHYFELETARVMQEVGFFGFIIVYALRIYVIILAIRYAFRHTNPFYIALCLGAAFFFTVHLVLFVINNPLAGVYYYALLGMVFATGKLALWEEENQAKQATPDAPTPQIGTSPQPA